MELDKSALNRRALLALSIGSVASLAACGGGGSSTTGVSSGSNLPPLASAPAAPPVPLPPAPSPAPAPSPDPVPEPEPVKSTFSRSIGTFYPPTPADGACYAQAIALPGKFDAIRIGFVQSGGGAATGMTAAIAATDDVGDRSNTNTPAGRRFCTPYRAGVEKNIYSEEGWSRVTVAGSNSWSIPDPGNDLINIAWSDVIKIQGIEDSLHPGWYPLLVRLYGGTSTFLRPGLPGLTDPAKFLAESGPAYVMGCFRPGAADAIGNLSAWSNANNAVFTDAAVMGIVVEAYQSGTKAKSILVTGDSRFSLPDPAEESTYGYRSVTWKMENALLAMGKPVAMTRCARGARTTATYSAWAESLLQEISPAISMYLCYSINDGAPTAPLLEAAKSRVLAHIAACKRVGAVPLLVSIFPVGLPNSSGYAEIAAVRDFDEWVKTQNQAYFSPLAAYGSANGSWVAGYQADANHLNASGYTDMANKLAAIAAPLL